MGHTVVDTDVVIPMRDGTRLSADVFRPAGEEPCPTLLHVAYMDRRHRNGFALLLNPINAVERGYAVVVADARGTFRSEGDYSPAAGQDRDGFDAVEWIAGQPWCTGQVGVYGSSGMGVSALQATVAAPPHLAASVVVMSGSNYYDGWAYRGGALELGRARHTGRNLAGVKASRTPGERGAALRGKLAEIEADPRRLMDQLPVIDDSLLPRELVPWVYESMEHPTYDAYWKAIDVTARAAEIQVPLLHISAWYDIFLPGHLALQSALQRHPDARVRTGSRFVVGPWHHNTYMGYRTTTSGERNFGAGADGSERFYSRLILDWFDVWLAGSAASTSPPVRFFQMGEDRWLDAESWPPAGAPAVLYLASAGAANGSGGGGELLGRPPGHDQPESHRFDRFDYDPMNPVPTLGGATLSVYVPEGVQDQADLETREDVLVYTGPELATAVRVAGPVWASIHVSSSAVDTDLTAKLVDVAPDGYCANIAEGVLRLRYRDGFEQEKLMEPGEVYQVEVALNDVAHTFATGHRIRLELSSSNYPRWGRNLNVATHPNAARAEEAVIAEQTIHHSADRPSHLSLHTIPAAA